MSGASGRERTGRLALGVSLALGLSGCPDAPRPSVPSPGVAAVASALAPWETYDASFDGCAGG